MAAKKKMNASLSNQLEALLRGAPDELDAFFKESGPTRSLANTNARVSCHVLRLDGAALPRVADLARALALRVTDYAIPRSEIKKAKDYDEKHNTTLRVAELNEKAKRLFTSLKTTGEGAELLLYAMAQAYLRLPQLFCKMSVKTNAQMHVHGADGVHVKAAASGLKLYWGEAKMYADMKTATKKCLDDIEPFLCPSGGSNSRDERDLQLLRDHLDLSDEALEKVILAYLERDNPQFTSLDVCGLALIAYDHVAYPTKPKQKLEHALCAEIDADLANALKLLETEVTARTPLETIELHFFLVPLPSVQMFRDAFLKELGNA